MSLNPATVIFVFHSGPKSLSEMSARSAQTGSAPSRSTPKDAEEFCVAAFFGDEAGDV
jgi:hypothetical protein